MRKTIVKAVAVLLFLTFLLAGDIKPSKRININNLNFNDQRLYWEFVIGLTLRENIAPPGDTSGMHFGDAPESYILSAAAIMGERRLFDIGSFSLHFYFGIRYDDELSSRISKLNVALVKARIRVTSITNDKREYFVPISDDFNESVWSDYWVSTERIYGNKYVTSLDCFRHSPIEVTLSEDFLFNDEENTGKLYLRFEIFGYTDTGEEKLIENSLLPPLYYCRYGEYLIVYDY